MHYLPESHRAETRATHDLRPELRAQNMLLQAVAPGLVAVTVGAVDGAPAARKLALPHGQTVVYLIPVGFPA
jgi:nitroreductase